MNSTEFIMRNTFITLNDGFMKDHLVDILAVRKGVNQFRRGSLL